MSEGTILELTRCKGQLSWEGRSLGIQFKLSCGRDGNVVISPDPIPLSPQSKFLLDLYSTRSRTVEKFALFGSGPDGEQIEAKSAHLKRMSVPSNEERAFIDLEISTPHLDLTWQSPRTTALSEPIHLEYLVPGLRCLGSVEVEASFGKVSIAGVTEVKDYGELTGIVRVTTTFGTDSSKATQLEKLDSGVRRLLDVLSLADGRFMQWSIRRVVSGGQVCSVVFRGPMRSSEPTFPLFSFINLQPIVQMAVEHYTEELCRTTGIDLAIEWFLMHPRYSEAQFLTGMTALEHLIHVFGEQHPQGGLLPKNIFKKKVKQRLQDALESAFKILPAEILSERSDAQGIMSLKLGDLNRRTLRSNLEAFLKHYGVPISDIEAEIPSLISLRNDIVHIGHQPEAEESRPLSYSVAVLRELLTRVFLSLLEYKGEYQSFLNGPEWREFSQDRG